MELFTIKIHYIFNKILLKYNDQKSKIVYTFEDIAKGAKNTKNIERLQKEFQRVRKKGYIKGTCNNHSAIGRTFENELSLPENTFSVPDYYGIEIKTKRAYSKSYITLFNAVPDGENLFETERLKETYGYPCKKRQKL